MDRFKNNIENDIFSNKKQYIKNRQRGNNNGNSNGKSIEGQGGEYTSLLLWVLLLIIIVIISYLTVMTAKYLSTDCPNKRSWFKYIIRFCYNDVCIPIQTPPVMNNVHYMPPGVFPPKSPNQSNSSFMDKLKNDFNKIGSGIKNDYNKIESGIKNEFSKKDSSGAPSSGAPSSGASGLTPEVRKGGPSTPLFGKKEVFHIANQDYTYEQARCKCESYSAKLATYDQLVDAYNDGAEWCTYGWSNGQKAYYPTQKCNWEKKGPEEKLKCGNPGLNGGFFADPSLKFGVNCYGKKPKGKVSKLKDPVCNGGGNYCQLPQNFGASNRLETDEISPFNNDKWNN
jgi:hypothetical protein